MKDAKEIARETVVAHVVEAQHRACEGWIRVRGKEKG